MCSTMRLVIVLVLLAIVVCNVSAKRKRKFEGDFEFADEDDTKGTLKGNDKKKWVFDPDSELCHALSCKKKEMCLLDESMAAFCVNKKLLHKNGDIIMPRSKVTEAPSLDDVDDDLDDDDDDVFYDSDDEEDGDDVTDTATRCKACPIVQPTFICGADNRTYSSLCRLDYHNCIHRSGIKVTCKGFCPCKDVELHMKRQKQTERMNNFMTKYKNTVERENKNSIQNPEPKTEKIPAKFSKLSKVAAEKKKHMLDKYSFVPKEFKYDNQHYKYIKYKYNKQPAFQEDKEVVHNEVLDPRPGHVNALPTDDCSPIQLQSMGNRLLDWFSVVMADSNRRRQRTIIKGDYPLWCKPEVRWMLAHLDINGDGVLSEAELVRIERDGEESCVKPWVDRCDSDQDGVISHKEWCRCFDKADRPCLAAKRTQAPFLLGAYVPECDSEGFYHPTQCHKAVGMCWCVDKHGVEFANTRSRSRPSCDGVVDKQKNMTSDRKPTSENENSDDDEDGDDEDEADMEASGDQPVDF